MHWTGSCLAWPIIRSGEHTAGFHRRGGPNARLAFLRSHRRLWLRSLVSAMLVIRPVLESDFGAIGRVFHDAVHEIARRDYTEKQLRAWSPGALGAEHWQQRTARLEVRVAVVEREVAGFIGFSRSGYIDL